MAPWSDSKPYAQESAAAGPAVSNPELAASVPHCPPLSVEPGDALSPKWSPLDFVTRRAIESRAMFFRCDALKGAVTAA